MCVQFVVALYNVTMNSTIIQPLGDAEEFGYLVQGGGQIRREWGKTLTGNPMAGRWVYRDGTGKLIDFDQYRNALFERNNLRQAP